MDGSTEMSFSGSGDSQEITFRDQQFLLLPGYVTYLSLVFQLVMTMVIFLMAGWVFITIKATRSLHRPHNIFVANLMIVDIILSILQTAVTIDYAFGVDLLNCNVRQFFFSLVVEVHFTYLMISLDKVIGVVSPFKYRKIVTPRIVASSIVVTWALAFLMSVDMFLSDYDNLPQYDFCISFAGISQRFIFRMLPGFLASSLTISLNIYLSIKAYKVRKQIERETRLSGVSSEAKSLKKKQSKLKKDLKPIVTLLMLIFGSSLVGFLLVLLLNILKLLWSEQVFMRAEQALRPNIYFVVLILHPTVYGLYFKQVRDQMVRKLRNVLNRYRLNTAVVAPLPQGTA